MILVITEQTWSTAKGPIESQPLGPPCLIDSKPSRAELCAMALSAKYHHHDYNAEGDGERGYWWAATKMSTSPSLRRTPRDTGQYNGPGLSRGCYYVEGDRHKARKAKFLRGRW